LFRIWRWQNFGRSAGYTLRSEGFGVAFCITEMVMDELFGLPFGRPARERWEANLRERTKQGWAFGRYVRSMFVNDGSYISAATGELRGIPGAEPVLRLTFNIEASGPRTAGRGKRRPGRAA